MRNSNFFIYLLFYYFSFCFRFVMFEAGLVVWRFGVCVAVAIGRV